MYGYSSVFENGIDLEIIEICLYLPDAYIIFKDLDKARTNLSTRAVPLAPLFLHEDSNIYDKRQEYCQILISFKLFVGPDPGPNFLLMLSAEAR